MKPAQAAPSPEARAMAGPRRWAGVLLIVTSALWLHEWFPALLVVGFVAWLLLHNRLEGDLGHTLRRRWRRIWPPAPLILIPLLVAGTFAYAVSGQPLTRTILPLALNLVGLSLLIGGWGRSLLGRVMTILDRAGLRPRWAGAGERMSA